MHTPHTHTPPPHTHTHIGIDHNQDIPVGVTLPRINVIKGKTFEL